MPMLADVHRAGADADGLRDAVAHAVHGTMFLRASDGSAIHPTGDRATDLAAGFTDRELNVITAARQVSVGAAPTADAASPPPAPAATVRAAPAATVRPATPPAPPEPPRSREQTAVDRLAIWVGFEQLHDAGRASAENVAGVEAQLAGFSEDEIRQAALTHWNASPAAMMGWGVTAADFAALCVGTLRQRRTRQYRSGHTSDNRAVPAASRSDFVCDADFDAYRRAEERRRR